MENATERDEAMEGDKGPIEFWFDFSSPYAYFASLSIRALAERHGRRLHWRAFMLGVAFNATGMSSLSKTPLRGDYARHDWARMARRLQVPFALPPYHPINALPASRTFYWIHERDQERAGRFAEAAFRAYFAEGVDMREIENVAEVAARFGFDPKEVVEGASSQAIKDEFKKRTEEALAKGVFGSPFVIVDGEPFWGADRLALVDEWLATGGW